ncbi:hypothetical protein TI39_contig264g00023 [Zymoseptoria brevis]|uniref:Uncharacterized protein n=1 Tax=Zymoseptoria brevis TaxID=1047168 RepID=A0A0F4H0M4_9PEZI|nr:hypothetical protein TI39_contig264g00023 [Zymoseptoria brevis]
MRAHLLAGAMLCIVASGVTLPKLETRIKASLQWVTCPELPANQSTFIQCANLSVPLDYDDKSGDDKLTLNLLKIKAAQSPSKGSVLMNPGGPGIAGRNDLYNVLSGILANYTGGIYDVVTWDPRGTGVTLPAVCFSNDTERSRLTNVPEAQGTDYRFDETWNGNTAIAAVCKEALKGFGSLIGSVYTARDMMEIVTALGEDGLLRYYGASYGTALGQIFAAIFPDKVDKMVLDGVLNPHEYITGSDIQQTASTEAVLDGFISGCVSRPDLCPIANRPTDQKSLQVQIYDLFDSINTAPYTIDNTTSPPTILDSKTLHAAVIAPLYAPPLWTILGDFFDAVWTRNVTKYSLLLPTLTGALRGPPTPFADMSKVEATPAIRCSDTSLRSTSPYPEPARISRALLAQSNRLAGSVTTAQTLLCPQWPFQAKERYQGDFNVTTKNPILFVGNIFDPITSLAAARNGSATFKGSGILIQDGYGHTSTAQPSNCTTAAIAAYFVNGTLPVAGTVCGVDVPLFVDPTKASS